MAAARPHPLAPPRFSVETQSQAQPPSQQAEGPAGPRARSATVDLLLALLGPLERDRKQRTEGFPAQSQDRTAEQRLERG